MTLLSAPHAAPPQPLASRPSRLAVARPPLALALLAFAGAAPAPAQATQGGAEDPFEVALRLGVAASSALVEDAVGPGADPVSATPDAAPVLGLSAALPLRPRLALELELGWSAPDLGAEDGRADWTADELTVLQGALLARFRFARVLYGRGGLGVIRYSGERAGGFLADDAQTHPYATAGLGVTRHAGRARLFAELNAQAHRFSFRALREAGGDSGFVWRGLLQAGAALPVGGGR